MRKFCDKKDKMEVKTIIKVDERGKFCDKNCLKNPKILPTNREVTI